MLAGNTGLPTGQLLGLLAETNQFQQNPTPSVVTDVGAIHARLGLLLNSMSAPADKKPEAVPVEFSGNLLRVFQDYKEAVTHLSLLHISAAPTPSAWAALHTTTAGVKNLDWVQAGTGQQSLTSLATRLRDLRAAQDAENTAGPVADPVGDYLTQLRAQRAHASPHQVPLYAEWEVQFRNFVQKAAACVDILHQEILRFFKQHKALACIASDASKQTFGRLRQELIAMVLWRLERDLSASGMVLPLFAVQPFPPGSGNRRAVTSSNPAMQFNDRLLALLKGDFLRQLGAIGISDTPAALAQLFSDHLDTLFIAMEDNWKEVDAEVARVKTIQNQLLSTDNDYKRRKAALYDIIYTFDDIFHVRRGGSPTIGIQYDELQRNTIRQLKSDCDQLWLMQMDSVGEPELQVSSSRWGVVLGGPRGVQMSGNLTEALRQRGGRQKSPFSFAPEKATLRFIEDQRKNAAVLQIPQRIPTTKTCVPVVSKTQRKGSPTKTEWTKTPAQPPPSAQAAKLPTPQSSGFLSHLPLTTRNAVASISDTCVPLDSASLQSKYDFLELHPCPGVFLQEVAFENHPRFAAAMNRLFIKRNNQTALGQKEVTEQEGVVRGIVAELALELRENTLRAVREMPFLEPRVNGVMLALLLPTLEDNDVFRTLLMERQNILNDGTLTEHLREHRLTLTEECLREKAQKLSAKVPQTVDADRAAVSVIILNRLLEASAKKKSTSPATSPRTSTRTAPPQPAVPAAAKAVESRGPATSPVQPPSQAAARTAPPPPAVPAAAEVIDCVVHATTAVAAVVVEAAGEGVPGCHGFSVFSSAADVVNRPIRYGSPLPELEFTSLTDLTLESNRSFAEQRKGRTPHLSSAKAQAMRPTAATNERKIAPGVNCPSGSTGFISREPLADPRKGVVRSPTSLSITSSELKPTDPPFMCDPRTNSRSTRTCTTVPVSMGGERPCATYGVLLYKSNSSRAHGADTETASCARRKVPSPERVNCDTSTEPVTKPSVTSVTEKRTAASEPPGAVKDSFVTVQGPTSSCYATGVSEQNPTTSEGACHAVIKALRCNSQPRSSFQQSMSRFSLSHLSTSEKKLPTTAGACAAVTRSPFQASAAPRLELGRVRQQQVIVPITPVLQQDLPLTSKDGKSIRALEDLSVESSSTRSHSAGKRAAGLPPVDMETTKVRRVSSGAGSPNEMRMSEQSYSFCYNRWKKVDSPENANIPAGSQLTTPLELCSRLNSGSAISSLPTMMERQQPTGRPGSSEGSTPLLLRAEDVEQRHQQEKSTRLREWTQLLSQKASPSISHYSSTAQQRLSDSRPHSQEDEQRQRMEASGKGTSPRRADNASSNHAPAPRVNSSQQPPPPRMAASRTDWRSATYSGMKPSIPKSASSSSPTVTASLYCNRTVGVTTPTLRKLVDSDPAPRPTVSAVHTRYVHRSDENKSLTAGGVSQRSATPSSSHLSARGGYQALLREQAEQNQNLKATVEGKFEFLRSRSPPISPGHTASLSQSCRTSMASGKMGALIANTTGCIPSLLKELQFEPGTPLCEIYSTACMAYGMRPNSGLLRTFPSTAGTYLQTLDLAVNYVGAKCLLPLFHVLENNAGRLQTLIFSSNNLENREVLDLVAVLMGEAGDSLTSLDLSFNPVSQAAGQALLRLATARPNITLLKLKGTLIPPKLMQSILERVEDNEYRKHIGLRR